MAKQQCLVAGGRQRNRGSAGSTNRVDAAIWTRILPCDIGWEFWCHEATPFHIAQRLRTRRCCHVRRDYFKPLKAAEVELPALRQGAHLPVAIVRMRRFSISMSFAGPVSLCGQALNYKPARSGVSEKTGDLSGVEFNPYPRMSTF